MNRSGAGNGHVWVFLFYTEQLITAADNKADSRNNATDDLENNLGIHGEINNVKQGYNGGWGVMEGLASTLLLRPLPLLTLAERKHLDPEFEWLKKLGGGLEALFFLRGFLLL